MSQSPDNAQQTSDSDYPKINFNLDAAQYIPKELPNELLNYVDEVEDYEEEILEKIDEMIGNELEKEVMSKLQEQRNMEGDYDSDDEDKWIPDYRNCACCHGYVYNCKGKTCISMGQCYCKMKDDLEKEEKEENCELDVNVVECNNDNKKRLM